MRDQHPRVAQRGLGAQNQQRGLQNPRDQPWNLHLQGSQMELQPRRKGVPRWRRSLTQGGSHLGAKYHPSSPGVQQGQP
jgi:hypothetical protein